MKAFLGTLPQNRGGAPMSNRRKYTRRALSNYPAKIIANDGSWGRSCRVLDVSDGGARLATETPLELPDNFTLALSGKIGRRCLLKWTEDCEIGVVFDRPEAKPR
jgi:hypothetical protein